MARIGSLVCTEASCDVVQDEATPRSSRSNAKSGEDVGSAGKADAQRSKPTSADAEPATPTRRAKTEPQVAGKRQVCCGLIWLSA